jgi:hypothetical protein
MKCLRAEELKLAEIDEVHVHLWDIFVLKKNMDYTSYSKQIDDSDICPPNRNEWLKMRKMEIDVFGEI